MKDETINLKYFENIDSYDKAYLLGFIAADGAIVHYKKTNVKTLTITIHSKDIAVLELLKSELNSSLSVKNITVSSKSIKSYKLDVDHKRFSTSRKEIIKDIEKYGISSNKSLTMPDIISNIPKEYRKAFIIGYFDGDGCFVDSLVNVKKQYLRKDGTTTISFKKRYNSQISIKGTYEFLKGIVNELEISSYSLKKTKGQNIDTLIIIKNSDIIKFYECYEHCNFFLGRKKDKFARKILQVRTISSSL